MYTHMYVCIYIYRYIHMSLYILYRQAYLHVVTGILARL